LTGRSGFWKNALELWIEHPIGGIGGAAYDSAVYSLYGRPRSVHNTFIAVLAELGLVGFSLVILILGWAICYLRKHTSQEFHFWLAVSCAWLIANMALTWIHNQPTWFFLTLLVSSAAVAVNGCRPSTAVQT
jgi:O-antigen ligase